MNAAARPLRLLAHPVAVPVIAVVPDGPPGRFRYNGADHRIVRWSGPERLETGWWRQQQVRRDYYCVESDKGCRYWLFRERHSRQWFVHGFFD